MKTFADLENDLKKGKLYFTSKELMIKNKNGITFLECLLLTDYKDKFSVVDYSQEMIPILCKYRSKLLLDEKVIIDYKTLFVKYYKDRTVLDYIKSTNCYKYKLNCNFENILYSMEDIYPFEKRSGALITRFKFVYRGIDPNVRSALENTFRYLNSVNKEESLKYIRCLIELKLKHRDFNIVYSPNGKSCFNRDKNTVFLNKLTNIYTIVHETMHAIHYNNLNYDIPDEYFDYQEEVFNNPSFIDIYNEKRKKNYDMHVEISNQSKDLYKMLIAKKFKEDLTFKRNVEDSVHGMVKDKELLKHLDMNYLIRNYISNLKKDIHDAKTDLCPLSAALLLIDDITASQFNDGHFRTCGHKKEYFTGSRSFYEFFADYGAIKLLGFSKEAFEYFNEMTGLDIEGLMDDFYNMAICGENKDKIRKKV